MKTYSDEELKQQVENLLRDHNTSENPPEFPDLFPWLHVASADGQANTVDFTYEVKQWTSNVLGICHGGVTATLADCCMGILAAVYAGGLIPTMSMNIQYVLPIPMGSTVLARTKVIHAGNSTVNECCTIMSQDGTATFAVVTGIYAASALHKGK